MQDNLKKDGHEECPDGEDRDDAMESLSRFLRPRIAEASEELQKMLREDELREKGPVGFEPTTTRLTAERL